MNLLKDHLGESKLPPNWIPQTTYQGDVHMSQQSKEDKHQRPNHLKKDLCPVGDEATSRH